MINDAAASLPPNTTQQEDLVVAGQRRINLIWERTQALIALVVVICTMAVSVYVTVVPTAQIPTMLSVAFGLITGFYFGRTNHAGIGGLGSKPTETYVGR